MIPHTSDTHLFYTPSVTGFQICKVPLAPTDTHLFYTPFKSGFDNDYLTGILIRIIES